MLRKYNDFLFESLILESIVVYSGKFKDILKEIDSPVAKAILDIETKDLDVANNYLDISDKDSISFITDRKAKEILQQKDKFAIFNGGSGFLKHAASNSEIFGLLEYEPIGEKTYHPQNGERGEVLKKAKSPRSENIYVKIQFPGGLTVVNENNLRYVDINQLPFQQNRQTIRTGRGVKALLSKSDFKFTDADIEQFVNKYKSAWDAMNDIFRKFELVSGNDIANWYDYNKYAEQRGTMGSSCMKAVSPSYFGIYTKNPDKCSLLILKSDDGLKIKGRAIVWKLDSPQVTYVDRIYTNNDSDVELFKQYAYSKGWYHKPNQSSSNDYSMVGKEGTKREGHLVVNLKSTNDGDYDRYPYLDTLKYFNTSSGKLTTEEMRGYSDYITLEDTGGRWVEDEECDNCGGDGRVDCYECDGDGKVECGECYSRSARRSTGKVECGECSGDGEVDCPDCGGTGQIDGEDCSECSGKGKISCSDCDGDGEVDCSECDGDGDRECGECGGDGRLDCPECQ
jgi:hypothetical protein